MKTFKINGKEYKSKTMDFNFMCDLEDMGVSVANIDEKNMSLIRGYFGLCAGMNKEEAGKEIQSHLLNKGKLDEITEVIKYEMDNSDFFRNLSETEKTEDAENPEAETKTEKTKANQ